MIFKINILFTNYITMENIEIKKFDYHKHDCVYTTSIHFRTKNEPEINKIYTEIFNFFAALDETYSKLLRATLIYESAKKYYDECIIYDYDDSVKKKYNEYVEKSYILLKQFLIEKHHMSLL